MSHNLSFLKIAQTNFVWKYSVCTAIDYVFVPRLLKPPTHRLLWSWRLSLPKPINSCSVQCKRKLIKLSKFHSGLQRCCWLIVLLTSSLPTWHEACFSQGSSKWYVTQCVPEPIIIIHSWVLHMRQVLQVVRFMQQQHIVNADNCC